MAIMRRVGEILKDNRIKRNLSVEDIANITKIQVDSIIAIENGAYDKLPIVTFTRGLIRNYAIAVGLNPEELLAVFRREYDERKRPPVTHRDYRVKSLFQITPTIVVRVIMVLVVLLAAAYFLREYRILAGPPNLSVTSPKQNDVVTTESVLVSGKTAAEVELTVNGQPIMVNADGSFRTEILLPQTVAEPNSQLFSITIAATAKSHKVATITRNVIVNH